MPEGPFGGPRPFANDTKSVIILAGVDGREPPNQILLDMEQLVQDSVNRELNLDIGTIDVHVTSSSNPSREQRQALGERAIHIQQYDIDTPWEEITQDQINKIHEIVIDQLNDIGVNMTVTRTTVV